MSLHQHNEHNSCCRAGTFARRGFLKMALVGGATAAAGSALPFAPAQASGTAEALLLSCMDFRLVDVVLDHKDCGAYRVVFGCDFKGQEELDIHRQQPDTLKAAINTRHPELAVELLIMDLEARSRPWLSPP